MKKNMTSALYHLFVIVISAGLALFLPVIMQFIAPKVLQYWTLIKNEELFLVSTEIAATLTLIVFINVIVRDWETRKLSRLARTAGLVSVAGAAAFLGKRRLKKMKEEHGFGRSVMLIGSTGFRTFTDPDGDLHEALRNCREAKIILLDPLKEGVIARARSLADTGITPEIFREQIIRSIDFLKGLKKLQKNVRLKLYPAVPLVKLVIFGDYLCLRHYPAGLHVRKMPEYVLKCDQHGSLFELFYQYFINEWFKRDIPEYDLDTDELVYGDKTGNEVRREKFNEVPMEC